MKELEIYKLLVTEDNEYGIALADELRWLNESELLVWIPYLWIREFIESLNKIFGESLFDDEAFNGNFQSNGVCFYLNEILEGYNIDLKKTFPVNKYNY